MGLFFAFFASVFVAASNFFMRRSIDAGGTTKVFLALQMSVAFLIAVLLGPVQAGSFAWNTPIVFLGLGTGCVLALMLYLLGKALESGPPGFTFSILSAATVMPAVIMATFFGAAFGFYYTVWHGLGSLLVLSGLFWAGRGIEGMQNRNKWVLFVASIFALHVLILVIYQWRAMLLNLPNPENVASFFDAEQIRSQWFTPMLYLGAAIIQLGIYFKTEFRKPALNEWVYGCAGGFANCLCTVFLIKGTEVAVGFENAVIFPLFSVGTIVLSNLWGQRLYQEKVNWRACQVCACGIVIGTVDWKALISFFGG